MAFKLGNLDLSQLMQGPMIPGVTSSEGFDPNQGNQFPPELMQMLGMMGGPDPATQSKKPDLKKILMAILPAIVAGGAGAAAGGSQGFGNAMNAFNQNTVLRKQMEQQDQQRQEAIKAQRMNSILDAMSAANRDTTRKDIAGTHEEREDKRAGMRITGQKEVEGMRQTGAKSLRQMDIDDRNKPFDVGGVAGAMETGTGAVPNRLASTILNAINQKRLQTGQQTFQSGERKEGQTFKAGESAKERGLRQSLHSDSEYQQNLRAADATDVQREAIKSRENMAGSKGNMSGPDKEAITELSAGLEMLDKIEASAPVLDKLIGPIQGRVTGAKQSAGMTSGEDEKALARVQSYFNQLAKLRSGGAVTPQEEERLKKELMDKTLSPEQFKARIAIQRETLKEKLAMRKSLLSKQQQGAGGASGEWDGSKPATADDYLKSIGAK